MEVGWIVAGALGALALPISAAPAQPAPKEPLIVTQMADPDRYLVADSSVSTQRASGASHEDARIDQAMTNFDRALGEAEMVEQQQVEAKCRRAEPGTSTREQQFAWAANCRYSRY